MNRLIGKSVNRFISSPPISWPLCVLCASVVKKYTFARANVRAKREIGRKNKIFFIPLLVLSLANLISLCPLCLCGKNDTFARANVVIAGKVEAVRAENAPQSTLRPQR